MYQIMDYHTCSPLKTGSKDLDDRTFVPVHMCFDVKFYPRRNVQLVAGDNITGSRDEDDYCWVFNIDTFRTDLSLVNLNDLEVDVEYVGNAYTHIFAKDNIYMVSKYDFSGW